MINGQSAYERILDRLRADGKKVRQDKPNHAMAQCPAHNDDDPSLSITDIGGEILLHCFPGCTNVEIAAALGWKLGELFYDDPKGTRYDYPDGRTEHKWYDNDGKKRFKQSGVTGRTTTLSKLAEVKAAVANGDLIYVCEGGKDVRAIGSLGAVATTAPQGAGNWDKVDAKPLYDGKIVAVVDKPKNDNDRSGEKWMGQVRFSLAGQAKSLTFVQAKVGKDAADHVAAGHGLADFEPLTDPPEDADAQIRLLLPRIDWHELWADDSDEEWIIYPLIPARRGIAIYSPAKIGKSLLMLEMAVGISLGVTVLGHTPTRRRRVLYVDFENDPRGDVRTRLQDMGYGPDDLDYLDYLSFPALTDLDTDQGAARLMAAIKAYSSEVVVIDTISRAVTGEENSNDTWLDFYRHTGLSLKRAEVAMIRLDHTGKDEDKGQRGGSAKGGDVDAVWKLTKITEERFRLECTFHRFQLDHKLLNLIRRADPLRHVVENLSAVTEREAKILHIIGLADTAGLPADAGWRDLQALGKTHRVKARTEIYSEAARRRKADSQEFPENFLVPSQESQDPAELAPDPPGTNGNQDPILGVNPGSRPQGTNGNQGPDGLVPGSPTIGGNQGTVETADPEPTTSDAIPGTQNCRHCGDPIAGPPLTKSCPGSHQVRPTPQGAE